MLELIGIGKRWQGFSLRDVTLRVAEKEFFVLLGPSGAGKTLLLELIAGFHTPDSGRVLLDGRDVAGLAPEKRRVGFVYQDSMLFPHRTARQNIAYGLRLSGETRHKARETAERLAEMLHIRHALDRHPAELSGGEKQRVSIARALAVRPRLLLMDEPLGSLDPMTQERLRSELKRVHRHSGVTVVHVTHDQSEARQLGRRVGIMRAGRLLQVGRPAEVFERPASAFVARFTGCDNIYEGEARLEDGVTVFRCGALKLFSTAQVEGPARAVVRPENIIISTEPVRTSALNQLAGTVASVEQTGKVYAVRARLGEREMTSLVTGQSLRELGIAPGGRVFFSFKANSLHLIASCGRADARPSRS